MQNLNPKERIGLRKLRKRVNDGEIVILEADKGNRFVVSSMDSFERQGDVHVVKDRKISQEEKEQTQARMNPCSQRPRQSVQSRQELG